MIKSSVGVNTKHKSSYNRIIADHIPSSLPNFIFLAIFLLFCRNSCNPTTVFPPKSHSCLFHYGHPFDLEIAWSSLTSQLILHDGNFISCKFAKKWTSWIHVSPETLMTLLLFGMLYALSYNVKLSVDTWSSCIPNHTICLLPYLYPMQEIYQILITTTRTGSKHSSSNYSFLGVKRIDVILYMILWSTSSWPQHLLKTLICYNLQSPNKSPLAVE